MAATLETPKLTSELARTYNQAFRRIRGIHSSALPKRRILTNQLRRQIFADILTNGLREWYTDPLGINLVFIMLWLKVCKFDRKKNTTTIWYSKNHEASIMAELYAGLRFNPSDADLFKWQETLAVYGANGDNTGCDWPASALGLDKNVEVKYARQTARVSANSVCTSYYVFVRRIPGKFRFEIVGYCEWPQVSMCGTSHGRNGRNSRNNNGRNGLVHNIPRSVQRTYSIESLAAKSTN